MSTGMNCASLVELFRWWLRLFPPAFRCEFGDEMVGVFAETLAEAASRGPWAVLRCVAREATHAPRLLLQAHLHERQAGLASGTAHGAIQQEAGMTRRSQIILYALAALPLAMFGWWFSIIYGEAAIHLSTVVLVAAGGLVPPALAWATRRLSPWVWAATGLATLMALAVPGLRPSMYGEPTADGSGIVPGQLWWLPAAALVLAAMLFGSSWHAAAGRRQRGVFRVMAGLLLAAALHAVYWQIMSDSQMDPRDWFWVMLPVLGAVTTAAVLLVTRLGHLWPPEVHRTVMIALAVLVPLLLFGVPTILTFTWPRMEDTPHVNHIALADLNGDSHLDAFLAVGNGNMPFPAYALYNDGTGQFDRGAQLIGQWPGYAVALGDVTGDGLADALLDITAGGVMLYVNDGGTFHLYGGLAEPGPKGVMRLVPVIGDLNGDGRLDVFAAGCCGRPSGESPDTVANPYQLPYSQVWLQTANGRLRAGQTVGEAPSRAAALADLNGDGDLDVFLANGRPLSEDWTSGLPQPNTVWLNDGQGNFTDSGQRLGQAESLAVALGDVNGDGWPDAVVGNYGADEIWMNDGQANFTDSGQRLGDGATHQVYGADLDGDSDLDLFLAGAFEGQAWLNDGNGQFTASAQLLRYATDTSVVVGDLTGDGLADVLAAGPHTYRVWANDGTGRFINGPRGDYR